MENPIQKQLTHKWTVFYILQVFLVINSPTVKNRFWSLKEYKRAIKLKHLNIFAKIFEIASVSLYPKYLFDHRIVVFGADKNRSIIP